MTEESVCFTSGDLRLEGRYGPNEGERGVVISHPHPEMGGSMHNNVVEALVAVFRKKGFSTLRFNFRGVGASEGRYDGGRGEQEDLIGAIDCLSGRGKRKVVLAGYSFGAWITVGMLDRREDLYDVILVSPPVDFLTFDWTGRKGRIGLMVCGDRDPFCPLSSLRALSDQMQCRLETVPGADHFYFMKEGGLMERIDGYLGS